MRRHVVDAAVVAVVGDAGVEGNMEVESKGCMVGKQGEDMTNYEKGSVATASHEVKHMA